MKQMQMPWDAAVYLERGQRRSVSMQVTHTGNIVIKAPTRLPEKDICSLLLRYQKKLLGRAEAMRAVNERMRPAAEGSAVLYEGKWIPLLHKTTLDGKMDARLARGQLVVCNAEKEALDMQVCAWYRKEAARVLPQMVMEWAQRLGVLVPRVSVRLQHKRWGSCAASGNISLNALILAAPPQITQTVVLHELIHRTHAHHQRSFYQALAQYAPDYRAHQQWLEREGAWLLSHYAKPHSRERT